LRSLLVAIAAALVAQALAGCGLVPHTPSGAKVLVTEGFGSRQLLSFSTSKLRGGTTAMSLLAAHAQVRRAQGGGSAQSIDGNLGGSIVQSIDGHSGDSETGDPVSWFYYVNGEEVKKDAVKTTVHSGDLVWWDLHDSSEAEHIPAVVGSFPEPFLNGLGGKRLPVVLECATPQSKPCLAVSHRFTSLGIVGGFAALGTVGEGSEENDLKVLVGSWAQLEGTPAARAIEQGPPTGGVYVRPLEGGKRFALLSKDGSVAANLGAGAGLIAATRYSGSSPVWLVTGTDAAGVKRAATYFDAAALDGHFAIAIAALGQSSGGALGQSSGGAPGQSSGGAPGQSSGGAPGQSSGGAPGQSSRGSVIPLPDEES
jgi:hypothetical protein